MSEDKKNKYKDRGKHPNAGCLTHKEVGFNKSSLKSTVSMMEEVKVVTREKLFRKIKRAMDKYVEETGEMPFSDHLGRYNIKRIPDEILDQLDPKEIKMYMQIIKEASKGQTEAIRAFDPWERKEVNKKQKKEDEKADKDYKKRAEGKFSPDEFAKKLLNMN